MVGRENASKALSSVDQRLHRELDPLHGARPQGPELDENPFTYPDVPLDSWEKFKLACGVVVVPVKLALVVLLVCTIGLLCKIAVVLENRGNVGGAETLMKGCAILARAILFVFGFYWVTTSGRPASRREARIVVAAPHSTVVDSLYLLYAFNFPGGVAKEAVSRIPVMAAIGRASHTIFVARDSRENKDSVMRSIMDRANQPDGRQLVIFPEGTCTNRKCLISFKRGAFIPGAPVQPVVLTWPFEHFDPTWTSGGPNRLYLLLRLLAQFKNDLHVQFLPVHRPTEEEKLDPALFASNVRADMAKALGGIPCTEHSYADMYLSKLSRKLHLSPGQTMPLAFSKLHKLAQVDLAQCKDLLQRYARGLQSRRRRGATPGSGAPASEVTPAEFAELLGLPLSAELAEIFDLLDLDGSGTLSFPEFVVGMGSISKNCSDDDLAELVFRAFDLLGPQDLSPVPKAKFVSHVASAFRDEQGEKRALKLFQMVDPSGSGFMTFEAFRKFTRERPEYLLLGLKLKATARSDRGSHRYGESLTKIRWFDWVSF